MNPEIVNIRFGDLSRRLLWLCVAAGAATLVTGFFLEPERTFGNLLLVSFGIVGLVWVGGCSSPRST